MRQLTSRTSVRPGTVTRNLSRPLRVKNNNCGGIKSVSGIALTSIEVLPSMGTVLAFTHRQIAHYLGSAVKSAFYNDKYCQKKVRVDRSLSAKLSKSRQHALPDMTTCRAHNVRALHRYCQMEDPLARELAQGRVAIVQEPLAPVGRTRKSFEGRIFESLIPHVFRREAR